MVWGPIGEGELLNRENPQGVEDSLAIGIPELSRIGESDSKFRDTDCGLRWISLGRGAKRSNTSSLSVCITGIIFVVTMTGFLRFECCKHEGLTL
jgi:hypothetical protein